MKIDKIYLFTRKFTNIFNLIGAVSLLSMMGLVVGIVLSRYVFKIALGGAREIVGIAFLICIFTSIGHCWFENGHVRITLVLDQFSKKWTKFFYNIAALSGVILYSFLAVAAVNFTIYSYNILKEFEETEWLKWPFYAFLSLGTIIFVFQLLISIFHNKNNF